MREYRTSQGDTWDMISKRVYGDEHYMDALLDANHEYIDIVIFPANIILRVPEVSKPVASTLPAWRRSA
jgi:phage tail protein X